MTTLVQLSQALVDSAALPLRVEAEGFRLSQQVSEDNLFASARRIARAMVFPVREATGWAYLTANEADMSGDELGILADGLVEAGLIGSGYSLVDAVWRQPDGRTLGTLATVDQEGIPRFEPILYFTGTSVEDSEVSQGSWSERGRRQIKNGFGLTCVDVAWFTSIDTNAGIIVDPSPHVTLERQLSNCLLWDQRTTHGEQIWCRPDQSTDFPYCTVPTGRGEQCLDWVIVTYVATGFSKVRGEVAAGGEFRGIGTEAKLSFESARLGSEASFGDKRRLCAVTGPPR